MKKNISIFLSASIILMVSCTKFDNDNSGTYETKFNDVAGGNIASLNLTIERGSDNSIFTFSAPNSTSPNEAKMTSSKKFKIENQPLYFEIITSMEFEIEGTGEFTSNGFTAQLNGNDSNSITMIGIKQ